MFEDSSFAPDAGLPVLPSVDPVFGGGVFGDTSSGGFEGLSAGTVNSEFDQVEPIFDSVEKAPVPVKIVTPEYPDVARRLGLEGVVRVKAIVEKDGRVTKATVLKSNNDIFNDRAVQAALQWVFVPGMMSAGPVRVWVEIPFHFRMNGK